MDGKDKRSSKKGEKPKRKKKREKSREGRVFHSRKYPRVQLRMEVEYSKGRSFTKSVSHNISHGGIFIQSDDPLPDGKTTTVRLVLDPDKEPVELKGRIAWVLEKEKKAFPNHPRGMGIEFMYDSEKKRLQMGRFMRDLLDLMRIVAINEKQRKDN